MQGYCRWPSVWRDTIAFVCDDDLWLAPLSGGVARRLTSGAGPVSHPRFSPDGRHIAFTGCYEGPSEVYLMPADGGHATRVTYLGCASTTLGWTPDGSGILFSTDSGRPFDGQGVPHVIAPDGSGMRAWPVGPAVSLHVAPDGRSVIGRFGGDPARWKRYRGGTAGQLWIERAGDGVLSRLIDLPGNLARPMWLGGRIVFLSDHEGIGNLYSCLEDGSDLRRHTDHDEYYARYPDTDGETVVYHAGGDLWALDAGSDAPRRLEVSVAAGRAQRQRKYAAAMEHLQGVALHPKGHSLALVARGQAFAMGAWDGPVCALSSGPAVVPEMPARVRINRWLHGGDRLVQVVDTGNADVLELCSAEGGSPERLDMGDLGRVTALQPSPTADELVLTNHRNELLFIDLAARSLNLVDRSEHRAIAGACWSPDGAWVAYGFATSPATTGLRLWSRTEASIHQATEPLFNDHSPSFDPQGRYLYFISQRDVVPVYDSLHFDLGFPRSERPHLLVLSSEARSPFAPLPEKSPEPPAEKDDKKVPRPVRIDLEGLQDRVVGFPTPVGRYGQVVGTAGKALFTAFGIQNAVADPGNPDPPPAQGKLVAYDFKSQSADTLMGGVKSVELCADGSTMLTVGEKKVRVGKAGEKPDEKHASAGPGRLSGVVDANRVRLSIDPPREWRQMAREAWRLQREYFWCADMSGIDWDQVWDRYAPLVDRISTRSELSDLIWEMQGELGTSHAYEGGGDYPARPRYGQGFLGADLAFDAEAGGWVVRSIVRGAAGEPHASSPLLSPGARVSEGDVISAIDGVALTERFGPGQALVNKAGAEVALAIASGDAAPRTACVRALKSEFPARYRAWVEGNRRRVREAGGGRCGYLHVPDMGAEGYAEFHRLFLVEAHRDALVVDVRNNRGGHVSGLLLEKLARRRLGYDMTRWGSPEPYPADSPAGPMVMLTNQHAGSDGDIVSHAFKLMGLGPLIGTRTWGGVIGIWPRNPLVDGSVTTQPEFSFWFKDVGWGVENYGTDPDIVVDILPHQAAAGEDPQLEAAIREALRLLEAQPPLRATFDGRPRLELPIGLPPRPAGAGR